MVMKPGLGRKTSNKNPPIFSHEFIIQNHADIVSCIAMVFLIGLMVQATNPIASLFIALHHNVSGLEPTPGQPGEPFLYKAGLIDACAIFFYTLVCIVMHAIIQEYFFDKLSKRFHLSKFRLSSLNESGHLLVFYTMSVCWGLDAVLREGFFSNFGLLWEGYPNHPMTFLLKLWWIVQASYWVHTIPELYFQRIKKEDRPPRIQQAVVGFVFTMAAYVLNFHRVGVCLIVLHGLGEMVSHMSKLDTILRSDADDAISKMFRLCNGVVFATVRLLTMIVAVLTFWYGLAQQEGISAPVRFAGLVIIGILQAYLMFNYITQYLAQAREKSAQQSALQAKNAKLAKKEKPKKEKGKRSSLEESDLPEVDQNTNKNLRQRPSTNQTSKAK